MRSELERLAADWDLGGRDESYLLRGGRLSAFDEWAADHGGDAAPLERQFIEAAKALASRQLEAARRSNRRLRALTASLVVLVVVIGVVAVVASRASQSASQQRDIAQRQLRIATAQSLAAKPTPSSLTTREPRARHRSPGHPRRPCNPVQSGEQPHHHSVRRLLDRPHDSVRELAFSRDGRTLATGSRDNTVILWDMASHRQVGPPLTGHTDQVSSVAFSRDGRTLATGSNDRTVILWDVADRSRPVRLGRLAGHTKALESVAFSRNGRTVASGSDDKSVILWNVEDRAHPVRLGQPLTGHTAEVYSVALSPDGRTLRARQEVEAPKRALDGTEPRRDNIIPQKRSRRGQYQRQRPHRGRATQPARHAASDHDPLAAAFHRGCAHTLSKYRE
jgi:WD domain, G-beta repeat